MKMFSTILTAAIIAGSCTVAMAQGAAGPDSTARPGMPQGADKNPTGPGANPAAGNPDGAPKAGQPGMTTAPVAGTPNASGTVTQPNAKKEAAPTSGGTTK